MLIVNVGLIFVLLTKLQVDIFLAFLSNVQHPPSNAFPCNSWTLTLSFLPLIFFLIARRQDFSYGRLTFCLIQRCSACRGQFPTTSNTWSNNLIAPHFVFHTPKTPQNLQPRQKKFAKLVYTILFVSCYLLIRPLIIIPQPPILISQLVFNNNLHTFFNT